jgi:carbonic anhydrase
VAERNVIHQLGNLRTHPTVAERLDQGDLNLHGWVYDLGEGVVTHYDSGQDAFVALETPLTRS